MRLRWALAGALIVSSVSCGGDAAEVAGDPPLPGVAAVDPVLAARLAAATAARREPAHVFTNRLALEASPYLLQHEHNPVSWYAWSDEAFERARREGKLVLVSVGYSTCHWCHVMEHESFEDEEVAAYLNANFICIKVDREERPDVDAVYMTALLAMKGSGGWPMNLVTDADRRPVFGATYMSKPQLLGVMRQLRDLQTTDPAQLADTAEKLVAAIDRAGNTPGGVPGPEAIAAGARSLARVFDPNEGGFGHTTKFPSPTDLELLLRYHRRSNDPNALAMVTFTLEKMAAGGIHDHLGGGFHRYATDRRWLVPHFEKMLYDNAQLAALYLDVARATGETGFATVTTSTLDYLLRDMTSPAGGFYAASDADSPGPDGKPAEGWYFTWTPAEIDAVLGPELGAQARAGYGVGGTAQVDGRSVLHTAQMAPDAALEPARVALLAARAKRPPPARDDKVLTAWNGLAISAFARAGFSLAEPRYTAAAARAADLILATHRTPDGTLLRTETQPAMLEDVAFFVAALLDLFEATWEPRWLTAAVEIARQLDRFEDPAGGYFASTQALLVRTKPSDDGVQPSGNAIAIRDLVRLEELTGDGAYLAKADRALAAFSGLLAAESRASALRADLDRITDRAEEIVIVAPHDLAEAGALLGEVRGAYLPNATVVAATAADIPALARQVPMLEGKTALGGLPTAFVCERSACKQPTSKPEELAAQLAQVKPL